MWATEAINWKDLMFNVFCLAISWFNGSISSKLWFKSGDWVNASLCLIKYLITGNAELVLVITGYVLYRILIRQNLGCYVSFSSRNSEKMDGQCPFLGPPQGKVL